VLALGLNGIASKPLIHFNRFPSSIPKSGFTVYLIVEENIEKRNRFQTAFKLRLLSSFYSIR
jgi:hypothetical protein